MSGDVTRRLVSGGGSELASGTGVSSHPPGTASGGSVLCPLVVAADRAAARPHPQRPQRAPEGPADSKGRRSVLRLLLDSLPTNTKTLGGGQSPIVGRPERGGPGARQGSPVAGWRGSGLVDDPGGIRRRGPLPPFAGSSPGRRSPVLGRHPPALQPLPAAPRPLPASPPTPVTRSHQVPPARPPVQPARPLHHPRHAPPQTPAQKALGTARWARTMPTWVTAVGAP